MERTIDLLARELGLDPVEIRRHNFIPPEAFPYATATGLTYDSGNFVPAPGAGAGVGRLCQCPPSAEESGYCRTAPRRGPGHRRESVWREWRDEGEPCAGTRRADRPDQGIHRSLATWSGDGNHVCPARRRRAGGASRGRAGTARRHRHARLNGQSTFASRGMTLGGSAMYEGLQQARQKMALLAAHILDCRPEDIEFEDGRLVNGKASGARPDFCRSCCCSTAARSNCRRAQSPGWSFRCILFCATIPSASVRMWPSSKWTATPVPSTSCATWLCMTVGGSSIPNSWGGTGIRGYRPGAGPGTWRGHAL